MKTFQIVPFAICLALTLSSPARAQAAEKLITVTGEATVNVAPDMARIYAGFSNRAKTAIEASDANNKQMNAVLAALKGAVDERDIQTRRLTIQPLYDRSNENRPIVIGFHAGNQVTVTVRDIAKLSATIDRVVTAGANDVSGIEFSVSDASKQLDRARAEAIEDARRKAEIYAKAAGVKLGPAVNIEDHSSNGPRPMMMARAAEAATPVAAGEQTLQASVRVSFELRP